MAHDTKKSKTVHVYGPDGKHEHTSWANAGDMVRNSGWSLTKPKEEEAKKPAAKRGRKGAGAAPEGAVEVSGKPDYPKKDQPIETMSRPELLAHIQVTYGVELDANRKTEYMVWWVQQLVTGMSAEDVQVKMETEFGAGWGLPGFIKPSTNPTENLKFEAGK